jgi:hypothetical protein
MADHVVDDANRRRGEALLEGRAIRRVNVSKSP